MRIPKKPWFRQQDQCWYVQIDCQQIKLGTDEQAAFDEFERLMQQRANDEPLGDHTVRQIIVAYSKWMKSNLAPTTATRRKPVLKSFGRSVPATLKIGRLRGKHVQKWIDGLKYIKGKKQNRKGKVFSPTTTNTRISLIQAMVQWAVTMGYVGTNPIARMKKPAATIREDFLPADTWPSVLQLASGSFLDFLVVMLDSGARCTEMFIFEAKHYNDSRFVLPIGKSKGRKRQRVVYLPELSRSIVERLIKQYPEGKLFRNSKGIPWNSDAINCRFTRLKIKLKMPGLCATTLRHSFAANRLINGQHALTVAKLLGHVDTRMISTRYGHLEKQGDFLQNAANSVPFPSLDPPASPNMPSSPMS